VSQVTVTDPRHFLFGHRLAVLDERSGRGPSYVVVQLGDGRKRSVRITATDLVPPGNSCSATGPSLPRIGDRIEPMTKLLVQVVEIAERAAQEEVLADVAERALDLAPLLAR
jgi:hypothetical protein